MSQELELRLHATAAQTSDPRMRDLLLEAAHHLERMRLTAAAIQAQLEKIGAEMQHLEDRIRAMPRGVPSPDDRKP